MPLHDAEVKLVLQAAQAVAIGINQRNIVVLADRFSASVPPTCRRPE
jgi:hypothetical protein